MYIEYCNYNKHIEDYTKEVTAIFGALEHGLQGLAIPIYLIREIREYLPNEVVIAAPIDFPAGHSTTKVREHMTLDALKSGANAIDYVPNHYLLQNKFTDLCNEIETLLRICKDYKATFRIFVDFQRIPNLVKIARIYHHLGAEIAFPTLGYHSTDFYDTLLSCKLIDNKTEISTIFNGHIWQKDQIELLNKAKVFGVRLYNLQLWCTTVVGQGLIM